MNKPTLSCPSPSGSCSSFFSSSAQSTGSLFPEPSLCLLDLALDFRASGESASWTDTVGLSTEGESMLPWLLRRPKALSISVELGRDESLRSSTIICGCDIDPRMLSSSGVVPASDNGTVTIESVGSGALSTCVLGDRVTASTTVTIAPSFFSISIVSMASVMVSFGTCVGVV
jgi:hypothetical protein